MRRSFPGGLPRVRISISGAAASNKSASLRPGPWAALLLLCGVLLLTGYARIAGRIRISELKSSSSSSNNKGTAASASLQPVSTARFVQQAACSSVGAAAGAAAGKQPSDVLCMQSMQQGIDFAAGDMVGQQQRQQVGGVSFLDTQPGLRDPADALSRHAAVHGHVEKAGMTDPRAWLNNHTDERLDSFLSWRLGRARAGGPGPANASSYTCPAADHPPLPFPGCHVFVNHE